MGYSYLIPNVLAQGSKPDVGTRFHPTFTTLVITAAEVVEDPRYRARNAFPNVNVLLVPLDDANPTREELNASISAAFNITSRIKRGERVLTICQQGRNRSGMTNAFTLINLGMTAEEAIERIREARKDALTNPYFVRAIRAYGKLPKLAPTHANM
jgi:protein-tyrosine phosphatase